MSILDTKAPVVHEIYQPSKPVHDTLDDQWKGLYKTGAIAALAMIVIFPVQMIVFFIWPPPATVAGWFELFQKSPVIGLIDMDLLLIVDYILLGLIFLSFYAALHKAKRSLALTAAILELMAITGYLASTAAFEMLSLSHRFAVATTEAERVTTLAAGQAMLSTWQGTAFNISYLLGAAALLTISVAMLRTDVFSKPTAWMGLVMGILMIVPPTAGTVGMTLSLLSLVPLLPWLVLVSRRLFRLARTNTAPGRPIDHNKAHIVHARLRNYGAELEE